MTKNEVGDDCERKTRQYATDIAISLLENVQAHQIGLTYDHQKRAYVDSQGNPVRDMHGQPINL